MNHMPYRCEPSQPTQALFWPRLRKQWRRVLASVPAHCVLCGNSASGGALCTYCEHAVTRSMRQATPRCRLCALALDGAGSCPDCALRTPSFDHVVAAFDYAAPGDLLVHQLKVDRRYGHANMLACLLADALRRAGSIGPAATILVPVPASPAALRKRGFNPAAEVARCLAAELQWPCRPRLLTRTREGRKQTHLARAERVHSARHLYHCPQQLQGASVAVVDDVLTTGSTLHSIAQVLKQAGAATVTGLVLARTPYR
ncbi:ComF family protein [Pollutimonas thiosulfatoxidans]|uniref:Phosphoribosyltransferase domain-containing protein n=1 Tax=Pollutimonas thiosulfatoxidans TaxID=2028345 RepID=A0A410GFT0_9BURK|nr:ComF family protein [Pollutimonas thiosulfatoxidans]MBF6618335.1 ComF family protein [Candidimonas sp.]QAA95166.1 hypothetical protein CKA81_15825 [Pollutimonas thiosulfatoxidans]